MDEVVLHHRDEAWERYLIHAGMLGDDRALRELWRIRIPVRYDRLLISDALHIRKVVIRRTALHGLDGHGQVVVLHPPIIIIEKRHERSLCEADAVIPCL